MRPTTPYFLTAMTAVAKKPLANCTTAAELKAHCPAYLGSFPEETAEDLYYATQDQIDLYDQGEESDIQNGRQRRTWAAFAKRARQVADTQQPLQAA